MHSDFDIKNQNVQHVQEHEEYALGYNQHSGLNLHICKSA